MLQLFMGAVSCIVVSTLCSLPSMVCCYDQPHYIQVFSMTLTHGLLLCIDISFIV